MAGELQILRRQGHHLAYRHWPGEGLPILLVHGMGSSMHTWGDIPERLADTGATVITVDLPGHGDSALDHGDYSLGASANALRDLLDALAVPRTRLIGHSLGGGVCLQFIYQFPERADDLILVASGGLGEETFPGLRLASIPGSGIAIGIAINQRTMAAAAWLGRSLGRVGLRVHALTPGALDTVSLLSEPDRRAAFLGTLRSVIGVKGQRVSALASLPHLGDRRVLIVWGDRDPILPMEHGEVAHALIPGSRLVIFPGCAHEPHVHDPVRFTELTIGHFHLAEPARARSDP